MPAASEPTASFRLADALTPELVGRRVVVRRLRAEGGFSDVLGDLIAWHDDRLVVRTRDGSEVAVAHAEVVAGKPVPPPPQRRPWHERADALAVQAAAADGWRALESARIGGWLLRAADGFTGRANSVLPLDDPGMPYADALAATERWYAERGLAPAFQVPLPMRAGVEDFLVARGWSTGEETVVMTADPEVAAATPVAAGLPPVVVEPELSEAWLAMYHCRGEALPPSARRVLTNADEQAFAGVRDDDGLLAIGRVAISGAWAGVSAMEVAPRARRRGLGRAVLTTLAAYGRDRGARGVYLQVMATNTGAQALYAGTGFVPHHRYRYARPPQP